MLLPLGFAVGGPGLGFFTNKLTLGRNKVLIGALVASLFGWFVLLFLQGRTFLYILPPLFLFSASPAGGTAPIMFTITRNLFPPELMGTASGLMNMAAFVGTVLYQPFTGFLLQQFPAAQAGMYSFAAYRACSSFFSCLLPPPSR